MSKVQDGGVDFLDAGFWGPARAAAREKGRVRRERWSGRLETLERRWEEDAEDRGVDLTGERPAGLRMGLEGVVVGLIGVVMGVGVGVVVFGMVERAMREVLLGFREGLT